MGTWSVTSLPVFPDLPTEVSNLRLTVTLDILRVVTLHVDSRVENEIVVSPRTSWGVASSLSLRELRTLRNVIGVVAVT